MDDKELVIQSINEQRRLIGVGVEQVVRAVQAPVIPAQVPATRVATAAPEVAMVESEAVTVAWEAVAASEAAMVESEAVTVEQARVIPGQVPATRVVTGQVVVAASEAVPD